MPTTTQNMTVTKGTQKVEVFEFSTGDYSKFRFQVNNPDGSVPLLLDGTDENNNWQVEITDLDCTITIQDSDTLKFNVGTINYAFSCLNSTSGEWEKLFAGTIIVSAAGGGSTEPVVYNEGRVGRVNVPISEVPEGVDWDIIVDSNGSYYKKSGTKYVSLAGGLNEVTYDELVDIVTGSKLVPEAKYKITDFVEFDGAPIKPIVVTAGSNSALKPEFYFYDEPNITGKYFIDNDQSACVGAVTGYVEYDLNRATDYVFEIPAIQPNTRHVVQVPLNVKNKNSLLCGFYYNLTLNDLKYKKSFTSGNFGTCKIGEFDAGAYYEYLKGQIIHSNMYTTLNSKNCLLVTRNYLKCRKFISAINENSPIYYGNQIVSLSEGYVYEDLSIPVIGGTYSIPGTGVFSLNKKIQLESAWLTYENDVVVLNLALYNFDTAANTPKTINLHVYE